MPIQRTLLERIRTPGRTDARDLYISSSDIFRSVLGNLEQILNTCQGNCLTDDRYGLPHLSDVRSSMPHSMASYLSAIRKTIELFEPRLSGVRIRHSPSPDRAMELRFEISGVIQDEDGRRAIRFETFADEQGRLCVK
jgi:type VI secretion system protein